MNIIPAQEIKRRGMAAVDEAVQGGPARIVKDNRPRYVVMTESDYEQMVDDLAEARLAASAADLKVGRVGRGTADDLLREVRGGK